MPTNTSVTSTAAVTRRGRRLYDALPDEARAEALSAAAIFHSNLGAEPARALDAGPDVDRLQAALGVALCDPDDSYRRIRDRSLDGCAAQLGVYIPREQGAAAVTGEHGRSNLATETV